MLTANRVEEIARLCQFGVPIEGDHEAPAVKVTQINGIVHVYRFRTEEVARHKAEIKSMIADLPDEFQADKGGGWSFLNLCRDKNGSQWTDLHLTMEKLCCLAFAAGFGQWLLQDRKLWAAMPGGVPYVCFDLRDHPEYIRR